MAHNKLVIIVNFPRISWDYEFDIISLAQEPKQTKSSHLEQFLSFLVPHSRNLTILIRTVFTTYVLYERFSANLLHSHESNCVKFILINKTKISDVCIDMLLSFACVIVEID